jgi:nucleoside triphosphate pyrophosphatase
MNALTSHRKHPMNEAPPAATLYLASRSPRRRELLDEASIEFDVLESGIDDSSLAWTRADPAAWASALAYLKSISACRRLPPDLSQAVVLGADTIVVKDHQIIGKPRDKDDARRIIETLRQGTHRVITGVSLCQPTTKSRIIFSDATLVTVGTISNAQIDSYLDSDDWKGKAGAYNLAQRLADGWPITWQGDPTTVMGLPMQRLVPILQRYAVPS